MNAEPDGAGWELAGSVRPAAGSPGWTLVGGWEDDGAVGLNLIVYHPDDEFLVRRVRVRLPVEVDAETGRVTLGEPEVAP